MVEGIENSLAALSLRALGISWDVLSRAFSLSPTEIRYLVSEGLSKCSDARVNPLDEDYPYGVELVGKAKLKSLLDADDLPVSDYALTPQWVSTTDVISLTEGFDAFLSGGVDLSRIHMRMQNGNEFSDWFNEFKQVFVSRQACRELVVMLPLTIAGDCKWTILRPQRSFSGQDDAIRLISSLSALGLGYRDSGHRTQFFADLIKSSQELFDHIGVAGTARRDIPDDELLRAQLIGLAENVLLVRLDAARRNKLPSAQAFVLDFSQAWQNNRNRFTDWSIHDRPKIVDAMADALLAWMVGNSGICLHLSLTPRLPAGETTGHDVQILAPKPLIESLRRADGTSVNETDSNSTQYYVEAPLRHKEVRGRLKAKG